MDIAHKETDRILTNIERRVRKEYRQASKGVEQKLNNYFAAFARKDEAKRAQVKTGELSDHDYKAWRTSQLAVGKRWEDMKEQLAQDYTNATVIARSISDGYMPEVYAINHNFATYEVETSAKVDTSYTLYDAQSVERLIKENPKILPQVGRTTQELIDSGVLEKWEMKNIQSTMIQGILQGESINHLAQRMARDVGASNYKDCVKHARTMTTATQNAGRVDGFKRAEKMGIEMEQEWVATLDGRTRHEHRQLDGQRRPVGEPFEVDGYQLKYPADPDAPYYLTMNCRCTLIGQLKGFERDTKEYREDPDLDGMTYDEWKNAKTKPAKEPSEKPVVEKEKPKKQSFGSKSLEKAMGAEYKGFTDTAGDKENAGLYGKYIDDSGVSIQRKRNGGSYNASFNELVFDYENHEGMNKYETLAHECGHLFDKQIGRVDGVTFGELDKVNEACKIGSGIVKTIPEAVSASDQFLKALREDMGVIQPRLAEVCAELKATTVIRNATAGVQDALDGFFGTQKAGLKGSATSRP